MPLLLIVGNKKVRAGLHFSGIILVPSFIKIGNWVRSWNGRHTTDILVSKAYVSLQDRKYANME